MTNKVQREREAARADEIAAIGPEDSKRLHESMTPSESSAEKRAHKHPDATPNGDGSSADNAATSTSGSKRHASAGAGPSERTPTTAERQGNRATTTNASESDSDEDASSAPTRRNDPDTQHNQKPMKGSADRSKSPT